MVGETFTDYVSVSFLLELVFSSSTLAFSALLASLDY